MAGNVGMTLIRPNGLIERLDRWPYPAAAPGAYGREQPGPRSAEAVRLGARQDRRRQRRARPDPFRGRLVDVRA